MNLVATLLMILMRINLPNFVQLKQCWGISGPHVLLFEARFFTTVNIHKSFWLLFSLIEAYWYNTSREGSDGMIFTLPNKCRWQADVSCSAVQRGVRGGGECRTIVQRPATWVWRRLSLSSVNYLFVISYKVHCRGLFIGGAISARPQTVGMTLKYSS